MISIIITHNLDSLSWPEKYIIFLQRSVSHRNSLNPQFKSLKSMWIIVFPQPCLMSGAYDALIVTRFLHLMIITLLTTVSTECVTTIKIMLGMSEWSGDQGCEILTSAPVSWAHITQSSRCQHWTPVYHVPAHDQPGLLCSGESWNHQRHRSHMLWGNTEPVKQNTPDKIKLKN